jgi:hypothetical protein
MKEQMPETEDLNNTLLKFNMSDDSELDMTLCQSFGFSLGEIGKLFRFSEFSLILLYFLIQGILIPNLDDIHYIFVI